MLQEPVRADRDRQYFPAYRVFKIGGRYPAALLSGQTGESPVKEAGHSTAALAVMMREKITFLFRH
jgi:hypothetical protein